MSPMNDTSTERSKLGLHKLKRYESLSDVVYAAHEIHEAVYFADADESIKADTPILWDVVSELIETIDPVAPTYAEAFGLLLAIRAILQHPQVLQLAAERIAYHLAALIVIDIVLSNTETLATLLPAIGERLVELYPGIDEQSKEASHE